MPRGGQNRTYLLDVSECSIVCVCLLCGAREVFTGTNTRRALRWLRSHDQINHPSNFRASNTLSQMRHAEKTLDRTSETVVV